MLKLSRTTFAAAACAAGLAIGAGSAGAASSALSGEALRGAVSDKTVVLKVSGFELPIQYSSRGTMTGRMGALAAALSGSNGVSDRGRWWIDGNRLCQRWSSWMDSATYCYALRQSGRTVRWIRNDGRSGTARISG